jgi:hypothetical protein
VPAPAEFNATSKHAKVTATPRAARKCSALARGNASYAFKPFFFRESAGRADGMLVHCQSMHQRPMVLEFVLMTFELTGTDLPHPMLPREG